VTPISAGAEGTSMNDTTQHHQDQTHAVAGADEDEHDYQGAADLTIGEKTLQVEVTLRGHFQPIDGLFRWYGRIAAQPELDALLGGKKAAAAISTPQGSARGELSDPDPWGRYRIMGTSRPPFFVPRTPEEAQQHAHAAHQAH
ncbi:MAG: DUF4873 domain-containing protein, partial [Sciscionella sp.]